MASAPTIPLVPVEEYLASSYEHDLEYVDGLLVERSMPTLPHSALQMLLGILLGAYRKQFGFTLVSECRVETVRSSRYRIPDVTLIPAGSGWGKVFDKAPWALIEIWSPDDRLSRQTQRYREFWEKGTREIIVLDPEAREAYRWIDNALVKGPITDGIHLPTGVVVPFSSDDTFKQLEEELNEPSA